MSIELIEYPDRRKLTEALVRLHDNEDVVALDVIDLGLTLRVVLKEGASLDPDEVPETPEDEPLGDGSEPEGESPDDDPEAPESDADADEEYLTLEDVQELDRAGLRALVEEYGLDIKIADTGGLPTAKVAEALGLTESDN